MVGHGMAWHGFRFDFCGGVRQAVARRGMARSGLVWISFISVDLASVLVYSLGMTVKTKTTNRLSGLGGDAPTDGANHLIEMQRPYVAEFHIKGVCPLLFRRWNVEEYEEKQKSKKNSDVRKRDLPENSIWRNEKRNLCVPSEYFRQSMITAAKFMPDPRSPRKSAKDLFSAGLAFDVELNELLIDGKPVKDWQYLDKRRGVIQRQGVNRIRPAFHKGWELKIPLIINLPEYISSELAHKTALDAGRFAAIGDFRPSYGRYAVIGFKVVELP
jgi:hypothetical protein